MLRINRLLTCICLGFGGRDCFKGCLEQPGRSKRLDAVTEPVVSTTSKLTELLLGDIPKVCCVPSGRWRRQLTVLAVNSSAQTVPASWLQGDHMNGGPTVSYLDPRRTRWARRGETTVHSSSLYVTHKPWHNSASAHRWTSTIQEAMPQVPSGTQPCWGWRLGQKELRLSEPEPVKSWTFPTYFDCLN